MSSRISARALALTTGLAIASTSIVVPQFMGNVPSVSAATISNEDLEKYTFVKSENRNEDFIADFKRYEAVALMREVYHEATKNNYYSGEGITPAMRTAAERELQIADARQAILLLALEGNKDAQKIDVTKIGKERQTIETAKRLIDAAKSEFSKFSDVPNEEHRGYVFDRASDGLDIWLNADETNGQNSYYGTPIDDEPFAVYDHGINEERFITETMEKIAPPVDLEVVKAAANGDFDNGELASAVAANKTKLDEAYGAQESTTAPEPSESETVTPGNPGSDEECVPTGAGTSPSELSAPDRIAVAENAQIDKAFLPEFKKFEAVSFARELYKKAYDKDYYSPDSSWPYVRADDRELSGKYASLAQARQALALLAYEGNAEAKELNLEKVAVDANTTVKAEEILSPAAADARSAYWESNSPLTERRHEVFSNGLDALKTWNAAGAGAALKDNPFSVINLGVDQKYVDQAKQELEVPAEAENLSVAVKESDGSIDDSKIGEVAAANKKALTNAFGGVPCEGSEPAPEEPAGPNQPVDDDSLYYAEEDERIWVTPDDAKQAYRSDFKTFEAIADLREAYANAVQKANKDDSLQAAERLSQREADLAYSRLALAILKMEGFEEDVYDIDATAFTSNIDQAEKTLVLLKKYEDKAKRLVNLIQFNPASPKQAEKKRRAEVFEVAVRALEKQIDDLKAGDGNELKDAPFAVVDRGTTPESLTEALKQVLPPVAAKQLKVSSPAQTSDADAVSNASALEAAFGPLGTEAEEPSTPESSTPESSTPESSTPESPAPSPEPSTPESSTPESSTPESSTPESPAPSPEPSSPESSTPEPSTPESSTPEPSTPESSTPEPSTPETSTPESDDTDDECVPADSAAELSAPDRIAVAEGAQVNDAFLAEFKKFEAVSFAREIIALAFEKDYLDPKTPYPYPLANQRAKADEYAALSNARQALALLAYEGNAEAQALDVSKIGHDADVTAKAQELLQTPADEARRRALSENNDQTERRYQVFSQGLDALKAWNGADEGAALKDPVFGVVNLGVAEKFVTKAKDEIKAPAEAESLVVTAVGDDKSVDEDQFAADSKANKGKLDKAFEPEICESPSPEPSAPETSTPEPSTPETSTPESSTPETSTPESSTPEPSAPETTTPEASAPESSTPESSTPETTTPEASAPETSTPESSAPETSTPEASAPETTTPETTTPKPSTPEDPADKPDFHDEIKEYQLPIILGSIIGSIGAIGLGIVLLKTMFGGILNGTGFAGGVMRLPQLIASFFRR
ncbi:hypothetical protein CPHO_00570 [Corynebacterium phocae]|uniref:Uncharacterized protein n=1 Tax=Corynebacterium phocae TaxID=161895 RepID=A0A1L7D0P9_9CORY|nr:hypothetical protein [Corynebacterium phocae]APT91667.1 hypothetical protein CPHO_00570 [Corynebacterium phocae]